MQIPKAIMDQISPSNIEIAQRKDEFKNYVKSNDTKEIIDKYLLFGTPYIFRNDENKYYALQREIEEYFSVKRGNVHIVGSSKLGFSISPKKRYHDWNEESDIDIALIDYDLFLDYWKQIYKYDPKVSCMTEKEKNRYSSFVEYFKRGWLRPDLFPKRMGDELFSFLNKLHGKYQYKVRVGIYADEFFFNEYNESNINGLKEELENGIY